MALDDMKVIISVAFMLALCLPAVCGCARGAHEGYDTAAKQDAVSPELPMPEVPSTLQCAVDRADYLAVHFWDAMDWSNPRQALDTLFMEQNFSNFIAVLPYASQNGCNRAVARLMQSARDAGESRIDFLYGVVEKYLWQSDSPMRNEALFRFFVEWALAKGYKPELAETRRNDILKNRPGSEAADFVFDTREGANTSLRALRGVPVILMFYEPDCDRCLDEERRMMANPVLQSALEEGRVRLLAIYIGDDRDAWQRHADTLPREWQVGIDAAMAIDHGDLYSIGSTPSFYLIDEQGRVVVKDAPHCDFNF